MNESARTQYTDYTDHTSSHTHNAQTVRAQSVSPDYDYATSTKRPHHDRQFPVTCSYFVRGCSLRLGARVAELQSQAAGCGPASAPAKPKATANSSSGVCCFRAHWQAMDDYGFGLGLGSLHLVLGARLGLGLERLVRVRG